jgi:MFS family permease
VFFAGLFYWGNRFKAYRRTTIMAIGAVGGVAMVGAVFGLNHAETWGALVRIGLGLVAATGLFVLAGATPAALGMLADISEEHPDDRGAIMGLYSVFLAVGQIGGSFVGAEAASRLGIDGILVATLLLLAIALLPLARLRAFEHRVGVAPEAEAG